MMGTAEKDEERRTTCQHIRCARGACSTPRRGRAVRWDVHPMGEGWQAQQNKKDHRKQRESAAHAAARKSSAARCVDAHTAVFGRQRLPWQWQWPYAGNAFTGNPATDEHCTRRVGIFHQIERLHLYLCSIYASLVPNA
eukprot:GHVU01176032.1.p4 GENE.GHVU01176032.1~~GHVU01176032.1.p4  ORF type:complete len:139 (-),score=12.31 GHVU01176032.1:233-649(-)